MTAVAGPFLEVSWLGQCFQDSIWNRRCSKGHESTQHLGNE